MAKNEPVGLKPVSKPIIRQKLSNQVFDQLWNMILSGELRPGDMLPSERKLMESFSVGRPTVREALQTLANKGVITISHGERSRVNEFSAATAVNQIDNVAKLLLSAAPSNLEYLKEVRKILEVGAVRLAAANWDNADLQQIRECAERQKHVVGSTKEFIEADIAFHTAVAGASGNPLLRAATHAMLTWLFEYYKPLLHVRGRETTTILEHEKLIGLIEDRDADAAGVLMGEHLDRSNPLYTSSAH